MKTELKFACKTFFVPMLAVAVLGALFMPGCASLFTQQNLARLEQVAADVQPLVAEYAATGKVDYAQAISVGLDSIATFAPGAKVDTADLAGRITAAVTAFTGGTGKSTGQKIAAAIIAGLSRSPTGAEVNAALAQASTAASAAANPSAP